MRESVRQSLKRGGLHVALVAMMLRALLPAGWMPMGEASAPLVICTAAGAITQDQVPQHDPAAVKDHGVCSFASPTAATPPENFVALPASIAMGNIDRSFARKTVFVSKPRFALGPPRAPPHLV